MTEKEKGKKKQAKKKKPDETKEFLPPLDFSSLVLPFYTQALIKLGMVKDPMTDKEDENVGLAQRLIDLLDLLKERTKGNLTPEEEKFLAACLQQLRMSYMEKTKKISL